MNSNIGCLNDRTFMTNPSKSLLVSMALLFVNKIKNIGKLNESDNSITHV